MNSDGIATAGYNTAGILCILLIMTIILLFVFGWIYRKQLSGHGRVRLTCVTTILIPLAFLSAGYARRGEELVAKGVRAPDLVAQVEKLERYLTSEKHLVDRDELYSLVILGDSTHYYDLTSAQELLPQIERALPKALKGEIELFGLRHMGLDAFDYYFLLNRLVRDKPDMILIPMNLRTFGENWSEGDMTYFPALERFTQLREVHRASYISSESRDIRWDLVVMRKLDYGVMDGRGSLFLRGAKLTYGERKRKIEDGFEERYSEFAKYIPNSFVEEKRRFFERAKRDYTLHINPEHSMLGAFGALNRLAREHGIRVVYYTVESDRKNVRQEENFDLIEEELSKDPDIYFINTLGLLNYRHFMQREHLTPVGIELLARYLANEVGKIVQQELGLTEVTFVRVEKGSYRTETALQILLENVEGMSLSELEAFVTTLEPEQVDGVRKIWERKYGPLP
ncbi:MAG TPA: hypothetical protein EYN96_06610 [Candidatus Hydrogenedentes bacterium]|nr:hypothetical protein [Candidatus Hydrogenedentota bacterium]